MTYEFTTDDTLTSAHYHCPNCGQHTVHSTHLRCVCCGALNEDERDEQ